MYKFACCTIHTQNPKSRRSDFVNCHTSPCVTSFYDTMRFWVFILDYPSEVLSDVYIHCLYSIYRIFPQLWLHHLHLNKSLNFCPFRSLLLYKQFFHFFAEIFWLNQFDDAFLSLLIGLVSSIQRFSLAKLIITFLFTPLGILCFLW